MSDRKISIREMQLSDVFVVSEIERKSFSCPWSMEAFVSGLNTSNQGYLVIEEDGRVVGFAGIMVVDNECEILNIAIDPAYRRKGYGQKLITQMLQEGSFLDVTHYYLEVRESNIAARNMYENMNFHVIGRRKNYYSSPTEDAILMELSIEDMIPFFNLPDPDDIT